MVNAPSASIFSKGLAEPGGGWEELCKGEILPWLARRRSILTSVFRGHGLWQLPLCAVGQEALPSTWQQSYVSTTSQNTRVHVIHLNMERKQVLIPGEVTE